MDVERFVLVIFLVVVSTLSVVGDEEDGISTIEGTWGIYPTRGSWSIQTALPMSPDFNPVSYEVESRGKKKKFKKKIQKFLLPLLLAYKLKFFTLIPVFIGGLLLLTGATGLAGFFFALFAAVMGLKSTGH